MTVIILAGGKASRMGGTDKAFLKISKETLIKRQLRLLRKLFKRIIIVTNSPERYVKLKDTKVISDLVQNSGPLGGIFSGLLASGSFYNFVVACDMPFINSALMKYMGDNSRGHDVVVPCINNRYEPLFAIYSKDCLPHIQHLLERRIFKINKFFPHVEVKKIGKKDVLKFGRPEEIFANINTPRDLERYHGE